MGGIILRINRRSVVGGRSAVNGPGILVRCPKTWISFVLLESRSGPRRVAFCVMGNLGLSVSGRRVLKLFKQHGLSCRNNFALKKVCHFAGLTSLSEKNIWTSQYHYCKINTIYFAVVVLGCPYVLFRKTS